jgi:hypothetical protein
MVYIYSLPLVQWDELSSGQFTKQWNGEYTIGKSSVKDGVMIKKKCDAAVPEQETSAWIVVEIRLGKDLRCR